MANKDLTFNITLKKSNIQGCFIKKLPLKDYFEVLNLHRQNFIFDKRLVELKKSFKNKKLSFELFKKFYFEISDFTINNYTEILKKSISCNKKQKLIKKIIITLINNRDKFFNAEINKKKLVFYKSEFASLKVKWFYRIFRKRNIILINDKYNELLFDIICLNYPELFSNHNQNKIEDKTEKEIIDGYTRILGKLCFYFSKADIDNLYIDQIPDLIKIIQKEETRKYFENDFQGIRYLMLSQVSYENDRHGKKKAKDMQNILNSFLSRMEIKTDNKSKFMKQMEKEALNALRKQKGN